jgi:tetratricopeptide (TPR) repeat protein
MKKAEGRPQPPDDDHWRLFNAEAAYAESLFRTALGDAEASIEALEASLGFKPDYAPALLSMSSVEYQRDNPEEGKHLFMSLLSLPDDTPDLCEIIDEAGDVLIQINEYGDGLALFRGAAQRFPAVADFHEGISCCAGHEGLNSEAIEASEKAIELEPDAQRHVNNLGWSLFEADRLDEARGVLERAAAMDPDDELARPNLQHCIEKLKCAE